MKEFKITIHHFGNGLDFSDVLFGREEFENGTHVHLNERVLSDNVKISDAGGFSRESKFAVQDKYVKINFYELTDYDMELLADHLSKSLSSFESVKDLKIGEKTLVKDKEKILHALKEFLETHG